MLDTAGMNAQASFTPDLTYNVSKFIYSAKHACFSMSYLLLSDSLFYFSLQESWQNRQVSLTCLSKFSFFLAVIVSSYHWQVVWPCVLSW